MNPAILINSHPSSELALDLLMKGLRECEEFNQFNIIVCEGGHMDNESYKLRTDKNITHVQCNHNSIDFTALITVVENQHHEPFKSTTHYFYMHDTCKVGPRFLYNIQQIDVNGLLGKPLLGKHSKNIGIYSNEILMYHKRFLVAKTKNTDEKNAMKYKEKGYHMEDAIFKMHHGRVKMPGKLAKKKRKQSKPQDVYGTGNLRIIHYYPDIDLYKIQANAGRVTGLPFRGSGAKDSNSQLGL